MVTVHRYVNSNKEFLLKVSISYISACDQLLVAGGSISTPMLQAGLLTSRIIACDRLPGFPVTYLALRSPLTVTSSYRIYTCFPIIFTYKQFRLSQNTCSSYNNTNIRVCKPYSQYVIGVRNNALNTLSKKRIPVNVLKAS